MFGAFSCVPELESLWPRLEEVISPSECDVYVYKPELTEGDPFSPDSGSLWSFNYLFFNRKLKRILCFTCMGLRKQMEAFGGEGGDDGCDGEDEFFAMEDDD